MVNGTFIVGSPRSGTTLVQSIIASHSEYYSPPETSFFDRIIPRMGVQFSSPAQKVDEESAKIILRDFESMTGKSAGVELNIKQDATIKDAFEALVSNFNPDGKSVWVEKTTNHATCMLAIRRFYPNARYVHVIRDPIDSVASMVHIRPTNIADYRISYLSSYFGAARLWEKCVSLAFAYPEQSNVHHIYFEDLVREPEKVVEALCEFLCIPFEAQMLNSFHRTAATLFSENSCPWQRQNLKSGFNESSVFKWRNKLSQYELWLIQRYVKRWAHYLGYYDESKAPSKIVKALTLIADMGKWCLSVTKIEMIVRKGIAGVTK